MRLGKINPSHIERDAQQQGRERVAESIRLTVKEQNPYFLACVAINDNGVTQSIAGGSTPVEMVKAIVALRIIADKLSTTLLQQGMPEDILEQAIKMVVKDRERSQSEVLADDSEVVDLKTGKHSKLDNLIN